MWQSEKTSRKYILLGVLAIVLALSMFMLHLVNSPESTEVGISKPFWQNLSYYQIVYLLADDTRVANSPMAPFNLQEKLGAQVVYTWEEVLAHAQAAPIGVLIIHDSALPLVDRVWIANAYRRGVVIAGFNLYGPQMANLVNDPYLTRDNFGIEPYPGSFYIATSFSTDYTRRSSGRSTYELNNNNDFVFFAHAIANHLKNR